MDITSVRNAYRRYAPCYDFSFGTVLEPGRRRAVAKMKCRPGDLVLEVGVGTGLSLPLYDRSVRVYGIDISKEMLQRARVLKKRRHLDNVVALEEMDAECMDYPEDKFDKVVAMYVASVVPHPERLVDEMRRVCKPQGEIFIVNHFQHSHPLICKAEKLMAPFSRLLGFKPDFSLECFLRNTGLDVVEQTPVNLFGYWTMLRARNNKNRVFHLHPEPVSAAYSAP